MVERPRGDVRRGFQRSACQDSGHVRRRDSWSGPPTGAILDLDRPAARRRTGGRVRGPPRSRCLRRARLPPRPDRAGCVPARSRQRPRRRGRVPGGVPCPRPQGEDGPAAGGGRRVAVRRGGADGEQGPGGRGPAAEAGDDRGVELGEPEARTARRMRGSSPKSARSTRRGTRQAARRRCARWWCCATCTARPARKRPGELGCPEGTVAARLHRARKKLGEALRGAGSRCRPPGSRRCSSRRGLGFDRPLRRRRRARLGPARGPGARPRGDPRHDPTHTHAIARERSRYSPAGSSPPGASIRPIRPNHPPRQPPQVELKVDQPRPPTPWKEAKVLELDGWLAGSVVYSGDGKVLFVGGTSGGGHVRAYTADGFELLWEYKGLDQFPPLHSLRTARRSRSPRRTACSSSTRGPARPATSWRRRGASPSRWRYFPDTIVKVAGAAAHSAR